MIWILISVASFTGLACLFYNLIAIDYSLEVRELVLQRNLTVLDLLLIPILFTTMVLAALIGVYNIL